MPPRTRPPCLRLLILPLVLLGLAGSTGARAQDRAAAGAAPPRNVVLILSDDHRFDFMGFHEAAPDFLQTPHLDRMARQGAHLANAFVTTSLCSPSRASILTGQYAHRHGVVDNQRRVPAGTVFFPHYLQQQGYRTAFVGKWHMGSATDEPRPGFDHWVSFRGQGPYFDPVLNVNGERARVQGYTTDLLTEHALSWLRAQAAAQDAAAQDAAAQPFFLYLSHKAVHSRFEPAPRHEGRYAAERLEQPVTMANTEGNYRTKPRWVREQRYGFHGVDHQILDPLPNDPLPSFEEMYRGYTETLLALDESVGRVLDYLEESGLADNTLVLYLSDNGFAFGEHGTIDKRHAYEESMRVPMLAWAPGWIRPGTRVEEMVQNIDVAPTILELAGLAPPEAMDGRSFLGLLREEQIPWRDAILYEYYWEWNYPYTPTMFALRTDRYKYIFYYGLWDLDEFYDLQYDPLETYNLIESPPEQEKIAAFRNRLFDLLEAEGAMDIPFRRPTGGRQAHRKLHD